MFRFTIRELVLLTLVVAMGAGWWLDRTCVATERDRAVVAAAKANEYVRLVRTYRAWRYGSQTASPTPLPPAP